MRRTKILSRNKRVAKQISDRCPGNNPHVVKGVISVTIDGDFFNIRISQQDVFSSDIRSANFRQNTLAGDTPRPDLLRI